MKLVKQVVDVWGECPTDDFEIKRWIERAGRVCYNSKLSDPPDPDKFIQNIMANEPPHSSVIEHSNYVVYSNDLTRVEELLNKYESRWINNCLHEKGLVLYGNLRAYMEQLGTRDINLVKALTHEDGLMPMPIESYTRDMVRVTARLDTDRNVLAEITRHRNDVGFSVQSQRYVDLKDNLEYIYPSWWDGDDCEKEKEVFVKSCMDNEASYKALRETLPPQHARTVLNGQCKTIIVMTAYLPQWDWIFKLRRSGGAYPQMRLAINEVYDQFVEQGLIK